MAAESFPITLLMKNLDSYLQLYFTVEPDRDNFLTVWAFLLEETEI